MVDEEQRMRNLYLEIENLAQDKKNNLDQIKVLRDLAEDKKKEIDEELEDRILIFDTRNKYIDEQIKIRYEYSNYQETKTQKKLQLLSCDLIIKKEKKSIKLDSREGMVEWVKQNSLQDQYIKTEIVEKLDWESLKKDLKIIDNVVVHEQSGIVLDYVSVEDKQEEVIIK